VAPLLEEVGGNPAASVAQVDWTEPALASLERIGAYIAAENPAAAEMVAGELYAAGNSLATFPERGVPVSGNRRKLIIGDYLIFYRVTRARRRVTILAVRHGAQQHGR
jgi:toxin ParE1/3/4